MSGGALNHGYGQIQILADRIRELTTDQLHLQFADHLDSVATAAHDLEWVLSGDYRAGDEIDAIRRTLAGSAEANIGPIADGESVSPRP